MFLAVLLLHVAELAESGSVQQYSITQTQQATQNKL